MTTTQRSQIIVLPRPVIVAIRSFKGLHPVTKNGLFMFVGELCRLSYYTKGMIGAPVGMEAEKIRLEYFNNNPNYRQFLQLLESAGLLKIGRSYQPGQRTKIYTLTEMALSEQFDTLLIAHKKATPARTLRLDCKATGARLNKLVLNEKKAKAVTLEIANSESAWNNYRTKIGEAVESKFFERLHIWNTATHCFRVATKIKRDKVLAYWQKPGFELIQNNDAFYLMPLADFQRMKRLSILWHYTYTISNYTEKRFYAYRDAVTCRKHSTLTNTPKPLLRSCITYKGNALKEVDLGCSQFTLFARCLDTTKPDLLAATMEGARPNMVTQFARWHGEINTPSTLEFCQLVANGLLYDEIRERLSLSSRDAAKVATMAAFYSNTVDVEADTPDKSLIRSLFPDVVEFMDTFKAWRIGEGGEAADLPKEMQRVESFLFVDEIAPEMEAEKLFFFTKHDSILVAAEHLEKCKAITTAMLDERLGAGNYFLKV